MVLPSEDDRDAIDRAFAELVAGYHLTADPPDEPTNELPTEPVTAMPDGAPNWATDHPLFGSSKRRLTLKPHPPSRPRTATSQSRCHRSDDLVCRPCLAGSASVTRSSSCWQRLLACAFPPGRAGSPLGASLVDSAS